MKFLSTGDLHIGTECDDDVRASTDEIADIAQKEGPDVIVFTGDIYDKTSSPEDREIAKNIVIKFASIAPVFIIKGNHDAKKDLLILGNLETKYPISVHERPFLVPYPDIKLSMHLLPWFTKAAWVAAKVGEDYNIESSNEAVSNLGISYLRSQVAMAKDIGMNRHIIFGHLTIAGARAENHQPLLGEGITFGYHDLVEAGFEAGAFGHIHLAQKFGRTDGGPTFWYNGSPAALDYGESAIGKRFTIYDTETRKVTTFPLKSIARITFDAVWDGKLTPDINLVDAQHFNGGRVKVKLLVEEGYSSDDGEKAVREFVFTYGNPLDLKIERATKPKDQVRSDEISKAKSAAEKLNAYWKATDTTPEDPMRTDMLRLTTEIESECLTE
jgi:DNA repair exonuclease SbcCD nuclease subunit